MVEQTGRLCEALFSQALERWERLEQPPVPMSTVIRALPRTTGPHTDTQSSWLRSVGAVRSKAA